MAKFRYENLIANYKLPNKLGDFWKPPENEKPVVKKWVKKKLTTKTKKRMPPKTVFKPCRTNPSGLTHFYSGDEMPWDVGSNTTSA